jgi:hypothetical protein
MTTVTAVVVGQGLALAAVERQQPAPVRIVSHRGPVHDAVLAAGRGDDWLWIVEGDTRPEPGALAALLEIAVGCDGLPQPALLAGKIVGRDGRLDPGSAPWPPLHDRGGAMTAAEHRLAAVRLARWGSLLVSTAALERHGPPRADLGRGGDDLEWTARLLRGAPGYLVPRSVAVRPEPRRARPRQALGVARMLTGDGLDRQERLWFLYASLLEGSRPRPSRNARHTVRRLSALPRFVRR